MLKVIYNFEIIESLVKKSIINQGNAHSFQTR
jgi:hypothetical protein